jgi:hypothetical protein
VVAVLGAVAVNPSRFTYVRCLSERGKKVLLPHGDAERRSGLREQRLRDLRQAVAGPGSERRNGPRRPGWACGGRGGLAQRYLGSSHDYRPACR